MRMWIPKTKDCSELLSAQYLDSAVDRDETSNAYAVKFDLGQLLKQ